MTQYSNYCLEFRQKLRKACLAKANNRCERCGIRHRSFSFNSHGEVFIVYLHAAHVFREQKRDPNAYLIALCPTCHYRYDHPRKTGKEGVADWKWIGEVARRIIESESRLSTQQEVQQ